MCNLPWGHSKAMIPLSVAPYSETIRIPNAFLISALYCGKMVSEVPLSI